MEVLGLNDRISSYCILYDRYHSLGEREYEKVGDLSELESKLFNAKELGSLTNLNSGKYDQDFKRPEVKFQPVNKDPLVLNAFQIKLDLYQYAISRSRDLLIRLKKMGDDAIEEIKKEYHFE